MIAFQTKKDNKGCIFPHYIDIEFLSENELSIPKNLLLMNLALSYKNILNNLIIEEEELFIKYKNLLEKNDYLSQMMLAGERQGLLTRLIQHLTSPYLESIDSEIYNIDHYVNFLQNNNDNLKNKINQFEKMNNYID